MATERKDIPLEDTWNLEHCYASLNDWEAEMQKYGKLKKDGWKTLQAFKGRLGESPENVVKTLTIANDLCRGIEKLYVYAHLLNDQDLRNDQAKACYVRAASLYHDFSQASSWIEPEILALEEADLQKLVNDNHLIPFRHYMDDLCRRKPHTLPAEQEELMALAAKAVATPGKAFGVLTNADFKFPSIIDKDGKEHELTHGTYSNHMQSTDRCLRKNAFEALHDHFKQYENSFAELLQGQVQTDLLQKKARKYPSWLSSTLHNNNIDPSVYTNLIESVRDKIGSLHRYNEVRKKLLGVDELRLYDMYVPLIPQVDRQYPFEEAIELCVESVAPLGKDYQNALEKGLKEERWVDRYENTGKRSGAYSSGCFDTPPYILQNYTGTLRDVFTLAHEAGHSMHSLMSRGNQPYHYSHYSIFLAEVASTFNEELLAKLMLKKSRSSEERAYLVNQKLDDIRATLFRQTMFAEFELRIHEMVERDEPLTPQALKNLYRELNEFYFGPSVAIDELIDWEWSRIPHFYYNGYVFQYATGISAALTLARMVLKGGDKEREDYLGYLKGGSSAYALDLLKNAGVDMTKADPIYQAIQTFDDLVNELESSALVPSSV